MKLAFICPTISPTPDTLQPYVDMAFVSDILKGFVIYNKDNTQCVVIIEVEKSDVIVQALNQVGYKIVDDSDDLKDYPTFKENYLLKPIDFKNLGVTNASN